MSSPGPSSSSGPATPKGNAPPSSSSDSADDSVDFTWSCRCTNIRVNGKISKKDRQRTEGEQAQSGEQDLLTVRVGGNCEQVKQSRFAVYEDGGEDRGRSRDAGANDDTWRRCMLCDVRVYKVSAGKERKARPARDESVEVDLSDGILYESRISDSDDLPAALPLSGLRLALESRTSNFGRPPQTNFPQLYPPTSAPPSSSTSRSRHLIPTVHDPFFLPPPFIPSHPHLKDLCTDAVTFLQETHDKYEAEVLQFVSQKASEMRDLEDKVRCEVEMLWNAFLETDEEARSTSLSRRGSTRIGSRSKSREPVRTFSPSPSARTRAARPSGSGFPAAISGQSRSVSQSQAHNPILNEAVANPAYPAGASLLSASISANAHHPVESTPTGDVVDDSIARVSQTYGTGGDARAVAMSHVFSVLDDAMSSKRERRRSRSRSIGNGSAPATATEAMEGGTQSLHGKDSWIDGERLLAKGIGKEPTIQEESAGNSGKQTPKPGHAAGKEVKRTVTFEDQKQESSVVNGKRPSDEPSGASDRDEERVFDLEMDGDEAGPSADPETKKQNGEKDRQADPFEQEISARYAAHAPSHRSAWKRPENGELGYSWYRKGDANTDRHPRDSARLDDDDQAKISGLATSMPVHIALPKMRKASGLGMERKTSLSEREGKLVPSLIAAMKQRGLDVPHTQGAGEGSRRVSAAVGTAMDPGVLHDLERNGQDSRASEEDDDDDEEGEEEDQQGTLRQSGFIPPHVIARNKQSKGVDGIRSIYDE